MDNCCCPNVFTIEFFHNISLVMVWTVDSCLKGGLCPPNTPPPFHLYRIKCRAQPLGLALFFIFMYFQTFITVSKLYRFNFNYTEE